MSVFRDPITGQFYSDGKPLTEEEKKSYPSGMKKGITYKNAAKKSFTGEVKALLKEASPAAARRLIELVSSDNERIALQAASAILDRVFGKPAVAVQVESNTDVSLETRALIRTMIMERKGGEIADSGDSGFEIKKAIGSGVTLSKSEANSYVKPKPVKKNAVDISDQYYDAETNENGRKILPPKMREQAEKLKKPIELADVDGILTILE